MNDKDSALYQIVDIVLSCCSSETAAITRENIFGKSRNENACMARCILVCQLLWAGFTVTTVSTLLRRSPNAVRHVCEHDTMYVKKLTCLPPCSFGGDDEMQEHRAERYLRFS